MKYNFPYLKDVDFLLNFNCNKILEQFVKLVVLTFDEKPITEIQGRVINGSISLDGSSAMRRTCNISLIADDEGLSPLNINSLFSINKKIEVLIGFTNTSSQYKEFPVIWFPQGVYVIISPNITHDTNGINISLTLHDKMALLNGQCGGILPASTTFSQIERVNEKGEIYISESTIYQIIQQLVCHFGGEQLGKIIISDIDNKIKRPVTWNETYPLYKNVSIDSMGTLSYLFSTEPSGKQQEEAIFYGESVGYILSDFTYPGELVGNAGETIVSILDKIKNLFGGNFEYFYDIDGNFRFQKIRNYLNNSYSSYVINSSEEKKTIQVGTYAIDITNGKSVYTFTDANLISSFSNAPQYQNIKNDFIIWGKKTSSTGQQVPIRYHLAIDSKPQVGNEYSVFFYIDLEDGLKKAHKPLIFDRKADFPLPGNVLDFYYAKDTSIIYSWDVKNEQYKQTSYQMETIITTDFRSELYLSGVSSDPLGLNSNYYYTELKNEWLKLYDLQQQKFTDEAISAPWDLDFYLDIIDTTTALSEFSVQNIGRRTVVIVDDNINCLFQPSVPNIVIIQTDKEGSDTYSQTAILRKWCQQAHQDYTQIDSKIFSSLLINESPNSAYERIRTELYQYTNFNQQISITSLPIYYLEPNSRITVQDSYSGIYGDYMIQSISLPLGIGETMNLSCTKALERI